MPEQAVSPVVGAVEMTMTQHVSVYAPVNRWRHTPQHSTWDGGVVLVSKSITRGSGLADLRVLIQPNDLVRVATFLLDAHAANRAAAEAKALKAV